jgi:hypothetical protein
MWFNWIIDFGTPGPDRGAGGKYLILPPGYDGPVPEGGFYVGRSKTTRALVLGRAFLVDNDPKPAVDLIQKSFKIYPYVPGGSGTSIAQILSGEVKPGRAAEPPPMRFVDGSGKAFNTVPPSDYSFFEMLNAVVQQEPADALGDVERTGQMAAIGIVKGKPFEPDARMKKILTDAAAIGEATSRMLSYRPRASEGFAVYPDSAWMNSLWVGGYSMETPPPEVTAAGVKPLPPTGARTLNARTAFFYYATGISPAMIMRLPGLGSQYLMAFQDADKRDFDGAKTYKVTLPPNIPAAKFWSLTVYDNQTRSMLDTPQNYPRAGRRATRRPPRNPMRTVRRRSISGRSSLPASSAATGSRPCPERAGTSSCASTARSSRSLPRRGVRVRSNSWTSAGRSRCELKNVCFPDSLRTS